MYKTSNIGFLKKMIQRKDVLNDVPNMSESILPSNVREIRFLDLFIVHFQAVPDDSFLYQYKIWNIVVLKKMIQENMSFGSSHDKLQATWRNHVI